MALSAPAGGHQLHICRRRIFGDGWPPAGDDLADDLQHSTHTPPEAMTRSLTGWPSARGLPHLLQPV